MPIIVPWEEVPADTLTNLIEEFVTRDGTDYGEQETPTATRVEQVRTHLHQGRASLVFDDTTETVSVMTREQLHEAGIQPPDANP